MKYSIGKPGRTFIVRLEDGDVIHECIESLAKKEKINQAGVIIVGGADRDSKLVVGPEKGRSKAINPMELILDDVHEIAGTGTIFPDPKGKPVLHLHIACGRKGETRTGCVRRGVKTWHIGEVIIFEIVGTKAKRKKDTKTGFELLEP
jgi:predicted DNA-binding protein with PD1-like motif